MAREKKQEAETLPAQAADITILPTLPQEFVKAEKNLESLGFFTPSSRRTRKKADEKVISFTITVEGKKVKASATILPSAKYGLPDTSDLDKYRAFQKILSDELIRNGKVPKHITFTSAELIEAMGERKQSDRGGKLYKEVRDWLMRMKLTGIQSEGAVWLAGKKTWVTDTVNVFDRVIAYGQELEDGAIADRHHVWLSDWQLENINEFWLLSIDYDLHKQLRKPIAKSLLPLLQIGFYASGGNYTKRYDELCQFLGTKTHTRYSYIKRQFDPSFKELQEKGFLANWDYDENQLYKTYNIAWQAGERFYEAQELLLQREMKLTVPATKKPKRITRPKHKSGNSQQTRAQAEVLSEPEVFFEPVPMEESASLSAFQESKPEIRKEEQGVKPKPRRERLHYRVLKQTQEETLLPIAQELINRGITKAVAIDFAEHLPEDYIIEKIEMHDYKKEIGEITQNAAGWLREAIARDYKLSEEQLKKQAQLEEKQAWEEEQRNLEEKAKEIQEQRLSEALANFPEGEQWVKERVSEHVKVREMAIQSIGGEQFTEAEIKEMYLRYKAEIPKTDEDKRGWLISTYSEYALSSIIEELRAEQQKNQQEEKEPDDEQFPLNSIEDVLGEVARQMDEFEAEAVLEVTAEQSEQKKMDNTY